MATAYPCFSDAEMAALRQMITWRLAEAGTEPSGHRSFLVILSQYLEAGRALSPRQLGVAALLVGPGALRDKLQTLAEGEARPEPYADILERDAPLELAARRAYYGLPPNWPAREA